jgi:hypothetical protein
MPGGGLRLRLFDDWRFEDLPRAQGSHARRISRPRQAHFLNIAGSLPTSGFVLVVNLEAIEKRGSEVLGGAQTKTVSPQGFDGKQCDRNQHKRRPPHGKFLLWIGNELRKHTHARLGLSF